jgi:sugar lactone lactonase YvrE
MMKKLSKQALTWILCLAMIFSMSAGLTVTAGAADIATIGVGSTASAVAPGSTVTLPVTMTHNTGFAGFDFIVYYDSANLTLNSITTDSSCIDNGGLYTYNNLMTYATADNITANGTMFFLNFTVAATAASGNYAVSVAVNPALPNGGHGDFIDENLTTAVATFTPGTISVQTPAQTVTAFDALDSAAAVQNMPSGTAQSALSLPLTLTATIGGASKTISGVTWNASPAYNAAAAGTYTFTAVLPSGYLCADSVALPTITVNVASAITTIAAFDTLADSVKLQNVTSGTALSALTLPDTLQATVCGASQTISGITWVPSPAYDAVTAGTYTFTAVLPDGYVCADGVALPKITVIVDEAMQEITAFDALSSSVATQNVANGTALGSLNLPTTLNATIAAASVTISGVTWTSSPEYSAATAGTYVFTAVLPSGYGCADGVALPTITIKTITVSSVWDGTTIDVSWYNPSGTVFYISTPAQLEGLAAIVNGTYNAGITVIGDSSYIHSDYGSGATAGGATASFIQGADDFDGKTVYITADLDMGGVYNTSANTWSGPNYMPIGGQYLMDTSDLSTLISASWNGTFNGQGHTIKNIYCNRYTSLGYEYSQSIGLIGRMGIHDNDVANGYNTLATPSVKNVAVTGSIYGRRSVGGIVGKNGKSNSSVIENCINYASVSNTDSKGVGGIVGAGWNSLTIKNCANFGTIYTSYSNAGGISGSSEAKVINCYNAGYVSASSASQSDALGTNNGGAVWTNCYWLSGSALSNTAVYGSTTDSTITMMDTADSMKTAAFLTALNGDGRSWIYIAGVNDGYPMPRSFAGADTAAVTSVAFTSDPTMLSYIEGKTFNTANLKITAYYSDGSSETVTNYSVSKTTALSPTDTSITISGTFGGIAYSKTYTISVTANALASIAVTTQPTNLLYVPDESFNAAGMVVKATYTNGTTVTLGSSDYTISPSGALKSSDISVIISYTYNGVTMTASVPITVLSTPAPVLSADGYYQLSNANDMLWFANQVNTGTNQVIKGKLLNGIDLSSVTWTPIGSNLKSFNGELDGSGYSVKLAVTGSNAYTGLCGNVGSGASIHDITVTGSVGGSRYTGGITGYLGSNSVISNCVNKATVTCSDSYAGGIIGYAASSSTISNCTNNAAVSGVSYTGGITGYAGEGSVISSCVNTAAVTGSSSFIGGITGDDYTATIQNCMNNGLVTGSSYYAGGIAGRVYNSGSTAVRITQCKNDGAVAGTYGVAGIAGYISSANVTISSCCNSAAIHGTYNIGGIVGYNKAAITDCYNTGAVTASAGSAAQGVGGIAGFQYTPALTIANTYNSGVITGTNGTIKVGAIIGYVYGASLTISNSYYLAGTASVAYTEKTSGSVTATNLASKSATELWALASTLGTAYKTGAASPILSWQADEDTSVKVTISVNATGAAVTVKDSGGTIIAANSDGTYSLNNGESYTYTAGAVNYVTVSDVAFTASVAQIIDVVLARATDTVTFSVTPSAAAVTVTDSSGIAVIPTSGTTYTLNEGETYNYSVSAANYATKTGSIAVSAGGTTITVDLVCLTDTVTFSVTPSAAAVTVTDSSGIAVIPTSGTTYTLNEGETYNYSVSAANYATKTGSIAVPDGGTTITVDLDRVTDTVTFNVTPSSATVTVTDASGNTVSQTGSNMYLLNEGAIYSYTVSADSYETNTGSFTVASGEQTITVSLTPMYIATLNITPETATVVVVLNGTSAVINPTEPGGHSYQLVNKKTYKYTISAPGYATATSTFYLKDSGATITVALIKTDTVTFTVSPASASVNVSYTNVYYQVNQYVFTDTPASPSSYDSATGTYVYQLLEGQTYFYQVSATGYTGKTGTYTVNSSGSANVTLSPVGTGTIAGGQTISTGGTYYLTSGTTGVVSISTTEPVTIVGTGIAAAPSPANKFSGLTFRSTVAGANLTLQDVYISNTSNVNAVDFTGTGNNLYLAGTNMLEQMSYNSSAVIHVGSTAGLTISGSGTLYMYKSGAGCGIGGNSGEANGVITLAGGNILIKGSKTGALIGNDAGSTTGIGDIFITGGNIVLINKAQGAAIGGSRMSYGGNVYLSGGTLTIISDFSGSAIGAGAQVNGTSGSVPATNNGTLHVTGGSFRAVRTNNSTTYNYQSYIQFDDDYLVLAAKTDGSGNPVYKCVFDTASLSETANTFNVKVDGANFYTGGLHNTRYTENTTYTTFNFGSDTGTNLYFYLTGANHTLLINGEIYKATWNSTTNSFTITKPHANVSFNGDNATVKVNSAAVTSASVANNGSLTFTVTPNANYTLSSVTLVSADPSAVLTQNGDGSYTLSNIADDAAVTIITALKAYSVAFAVTPASATVTVKDSGGNLISAIGGIYTLTAGDTYGYTVSAAGYAAKSGTLTVTSDRTGVSAVTVTLVSTTPASSTVFGSYAIGTTANSIKLNGISDLVVNAAGHTFITDYYNGRVVEYDAAGKYVASYGTVGTGANQMTKPMGIAIDASGYLYVADSGNSRIVRFLPSAGAITNWQTYGTLGSGANQLSKPLGVAVKDGTIYVADTGNNRIATFDTAGANWHAYGTKGSGDGQFGNPYDVAVDTQGNIWVSDTMNKRVEELDAAGNFLKAYTGYDYTYGLAIDGYGNVFVTERATGLIKCVNSTAVYGGKGTVTGKFTNPVGLFIGTDNVLWVVDVTSGKVQKTQITY